MFLFPSLSSALLRAELSKSFFDSITLCKELCAAVLANSTFRFLGHMVKTTACNKLIIADKASVFMVPVELPWLTKRREMERDVCLAGLK